MPLLFSCLAPSTADHSVQVADSDKDSLFAFLSLPVTATGQINPSELHGRIVAAMEEINSKISDDHTAQQETVRVARVAYALGGLYSLAVEAQQAGLDITWK